jgi:hypothetical protein
MGAFVSVICFKTVVLSARKQMLMNPCSFASSIGRTPRLTNIFYQYECGLSTLSTTSSRQLKSCLLIKVMKGVVQQGGCCLLLPERQKNFRGTA